MLLMPMFSPSSDRDELHARHAPKSRLALREKLNALLDQLGADDRNHRAGENALGVLDPDLRRVASDLARVLHMNFHEVDDVRVKHHLRARDHRHGLRDPHRSDLDSLSPSAALALPCHRVPPSPWRGRAYTPSPAPGLATRRPHSALAPASLHDAPSALEADAPRARQFHRALGLSGALSRHGFKTGRVLMKRLFARWETPAWVAAFATVRLRDDAIEIADHETPRFIAVEVAVHRPNMRATQMAAPANAAVTNRVVHATRLPMNGNRAWFRFALA